MTDFDIFYAAAKALTLGLSPYSVPGFFNPAWALLPFIPLTLLPREVAHNIYSIASIAVLVVALARFKVWPPAILIFVFLTPLAVNMIENGNMDQIVLLGVTFPVPAAVWFAAMKPQITFGLFILWAFQRHWKALIVVTVAVILNYALLGLPDVRTSYSWGRAGADVFPWGIPIGLYLLRRAVQRNDRAYALVSAGFISPYYSFNSWVSIFTLARTRRATLIVFGLAWALFLAYLYGII